MSFSDRPTLTIGKKVACIGYMVVAAYAVLVCLIEAVAPTSDAPPPPIWKSLLWFPGSLVLAIAGMVQLVRFLMRDKS